MNTSRLFNFIATLFCLCLLFSNASGQISDAEVTKTETKIKVCPIELTESARTVTFRFTYIYRLLTDETGSSEKIDVLKDNSKYKFVKDENFLPCLRSWKLKPSSKYFIFISVGTTGGDNYIQFSEIGSKEIIKLIL